MNRFVLGLFFCLISWVAVANIDAYDFHGDVELEQRFRTMIEELRCPKCQNANIAGSNAPLAKDIKDRVYKMMVEEHKSDEQIMAWAEQRYGTFITYRPPLTATTLVLWVGPFAAFVLACIVLVVRMRSKRIAAMKANAHLSDQEKAHLDSLLERYRNSADK
ncbi:MAG TPA: cytochrome c-type biogenesis protein [Pseudomonadales bacterium]|nr:cytochrome c-type biogenesis protein [Pseudomonadales bacterium]